MPDTGAPWSLPYPATSGLVRNAPENFEDLAVATANGLTAAAKGALIKQTRLTRITDVTSTTDTEVITDTVSYTPLRADSILSIEWFGSYYIDRFASSPRVRIVIFRIKEGTNALQTHLGGRELISTSSAFAGMGGPIYLRHLTTSGSTSARTYNFAMQNSSVNVECTSRGDDFLNGPNQIVISEYISEIS
jgi:hypothetical protein